MLLPRFKLRTALVCLTAAAFVSLFFREGARGTEWAIGATIGIASLLLWLILMALFYGMAMILRPSSLTPSAERIKGSFYASANTASSETVSTDSASSNIALSNTALSNTASDEKNAIDKSSDDKSMVDQAGDWLEGDRDE